MELSSTLERARLLLEDSFDLDLKPLAMSQLVRRSIAPHMGKYATAGRLVLEYWYVDYALAACRRLAGRGKDEVSVYRALETLLAVADDLTAEVLFEHHRSLGHADPEYPHDLPLVGQSIRFVVDGARPDSEPLKTDVVGRATVEADMDRLEEVTLRVAELATRRTAHRLTPERIEERGGDFSITIADIDNLVETVSQIYKRWALLLRRVSVDTTVSHLDPARALALALRLYDPEAFRDVMFAHNREAMSDPDRSVTNLGELADRVRVHYVIDE